MDRRHAERIKAIGSVDDAKMDRNRQGTDKILLAAFKSKVKAILSAKDNPSKRALPHRIQTNRGLEHHGGSNDKNSLDRPGTPSPHLEAGRGGAPHFPFPNPFGSVPFNIGIFPTGAFKKV